MHRAVVAALALSIGTPVLAADVFADAAQAEAAVRLATPEVEALRGHAFSGTFSVRVITPGEAADYLLGKVTRMLTDDERYAMGRSMAAFGIVSPGFDVEAAILGVVEGQLAGFYEPSDDALYLVVRDAGYVPAGADAGKVAADSAERLTVVHELVHALQDQIVDIARLVDERLDDADAGAAFKALVEGDASLVMYRALVEGGVLDYAALDALLGEQSPEEVAEALGVPVALGAAVVFPYVEGARLASTVYDAGGVAALDAALADPPLSTEQVLHPEKLGVDRPMRVDLPDVRPAFGDGWRVLEVDTQGELGIRLMLRQLAPQVGADDVAAGWDGDRYAVIEGPRGELAVAWHTRWDTVDDARAFASAVPEWLLGASRRTPGFGDEIGLVRGRIAEARRRGRAVDVIVGVPPDRAAAVRRALRHARSRPARSFDDLAHRGG